MPKPITFRTLTRCFRAKRRTTVWVEGRDVAGASEKYKQFGQPAAIVKDYVKSAKHRWKEACFIPSGTERPRFDEILQAFLEARGDLFEKGIVLRRFHEFVKLADDIRGQPVHEDTACSCSWDAACGRTSHSRGWTIRTIGRVGSHRPPI